MTEIKYKLLTPDAKPPVIAFDGTSKTMGIDVYCSEDIVIRTAAKYKSYKRIGELPNPEGMATVSQHKRYDDAPRGQWEFAPEKPLADSKGNVVTKVTWDGLTFADDLQFEEVLVDETDAQHPYPSLLPYAIIPTGIALELPDNVHVSWGGKSGYAFNQGIIAFEGKIDSNYRNELKLMLWSLNPEVDGQIIPKGTKVAQLYVIHYQDEYSLAEVSDLAASDRKDGFGSTGLT